MFLFIHHIYIKYIYTFKHVVMRKRLQKGAFMGNEKVNPVGATTQSTQSTPVRRQRTEEKVNSVITESKKGNETPVVENDTIIMKHDTVYVDKDEVVRDTVYLSEEDRLAAQRQQRIKKVANNIVSQLYKSIDGLGTDDELFEKTLNRINKDNILEVIEEWDRTCGQEYGESFFESFLGDADSAQRKKYGAQLMNALVERANEIGRNDNGIEIRLPEYEKELNSKFFVNNSKLAAIFNAIADETILYQRGADAAESLSITLEEPIIYDTGKAELHEQTGFDENGNPVYEVTNLQRLDPGEYTSEPVYLLGGELYRKVEE